MLGHCTDIIVKFYGCADVFACIRLQGRYLSEIPFREVLECIHLPSHEACTHLGLGACVNVIRNTPIRISSYI